uniref:Uncharacterized protein n=1 Tax=Brassica oleracea var. oleracea TaxID=109376 RepID=A0A0D3BB92_BRAOL
MNGTVADETQNLPPTHRHDTLPLALSPHTRHHLLSVCHQRTLKNKPKLTTIETLTPPPEIPSRRKQRSSDPRNHPTKPPSNLSTTGAPPSRGADKLRRGFLTPHAPSLLRNHQRQGKSEPVRDTIRTRSEAKVEQSPSSSDATIQNANRDPMGSPDLRPTMKPPHHRRKRDRGGDHRHENTEPEPGGRLERWRPPENEGGDLKP